MKKIHFICLLLFLSIRGFSQNVGIGTLNPTQSAILELKDSARGFLPPRLTIAQRNAIQNPVAGLEIWNVDCEELEVYNGTVWTNMIGGTACINYTPLPSVAICNQVWTTKNLDVSQYRNGDIIPQVTDNNIWDSLTTGAWCWYNNDSATYASAFGKLYNWYAVNDSRGLAPLGWHIPSLAEWKIVIKCIDPNADTTCGSCPSNSISQIAGGAMKETGTAHWQSPNTGATNSSGFTGLGDGFREFGTFESILVNGNWWSSTQTSAGIASATNIGFGGTTVEITGNPEEFGFSVRCIKN